MKTGTLSLFSEQENLHFQSFLSKPVPPKPRFLRKEVSFSFQWKSTFFKDFLEMIAWILKKQASSDVTKKLIFVGVEVKTISFSLKSYFLCSFETFSPRSTENVKFDLNLYLKHQTWTSRLGCLSFRIKRFFVEKLILHQTAATVRGKIHRKGKDYIVSPHPVLLLRR